MNELLEQKWEFLNKILEERFGKAPTMETTLFLIGVQELNTSRFSFTKEEKEDLMHIATCTLLSDDGYYAFDHRDKDGWPHFKKLKTPPVMNLDAQEDFLKVQVIRYFEKAGLINIDSSSNQ